LPDRQTQQLHQIETAARERCTGHDPAHDGLHLARVVENARWLVAEEAARGRSANPFVVEAACWLHDLVQLPKGSGQPGESARLSSAEAALILTSLGVSVAEVEEIQHAIASHSFSGGLVPRTTEAAIVQDADRLDALGAVGLARLWATAATLGSLLYDPDDPAAQTRPLNDRHYALDHIPAKLVKLPALMNTESGRAAAEERLATVLLFRDRFMAEIRGAQEG
jgi:uncharacterized protein